MRPLVGCTPTSPEYAAGNRVEPPPSDPMVNGNIAATADAALPELDQPGTLPVSHGLRASTSQLKLVARSAPESSRVAPDPIIVLVPTMIAPASRSRSTPKSSRVATEPVPRLIRGIPATAMCSFTAVGIPCNGPSSSPARTASSARFACSRAPAWSTRENACSFGSTSSIRPRKWSTTSTGDTSPAPISSRIFHAGIQVSSSDITSLLEVTECQLATGREEVGQGTGKRERSRGLTSPAPLDSDALRSDVERHLERTAHDERLGLLRQVLDDLAVRERVGHALGVREVGAEHEVVGGQPEVEQTLRVWLVEDVEPDVALEDLEGIFVEQHRGVGVGTLE